MVSAKMEAEIRRSVALILMKHNHYVGARNKLLDAQTSYPGLEYVDELIKVCDIAVCTAESGSGTDWYSVLQANRTGDESDLDFKYTELIRILEPVKNKFPEIQSALGLIEKAYIVFSDREKRYEFDCRRDGPKGPCGSAKPLDIVTSQSSSGTMTVTKGSNESKSVCNSLQQPLKRVRSLGGDDFEVTAKTQSLDKPIGKVCVAKHDGTRLNEVEGSLGRLYGSPVEAMVHKEPSLEFYDFSKHIKANVFAIGQFWAVYDQEKMPRLYARINKIESRYKNETNSTESTLYVRWLRPAPINLHEKKWHEVGLPVSCGFFMLDSGKIDKFTIVVGSRSVFSHLVCPSQKYYSQEFYQICPRKGEVWALYEEWKPFSWCWDPEKRKGCKFQLVEILSDYSTAAGVKVASLVKVAGFETIFRRSGLYSQIAARNLFGFSHNIPVRFADDEKDVISGMVLELDPLSIPEDVVVEPVASEVSGPSSTKNLNSRSPPRTSELHPEINKVNQCAREVAPGDRNVKRFKTTSQLRLVSPKTCEENRRQTDGTLQYENDGSLREKVGNTATSDEEKVAEEIDSQSDGVSLGGYMVDDSECGNSSGDLDDAVNMLEHNQVVEIIKRNRNRESKWQTEDDMLSSLEEDDVLRLIAN